MIILNINEIINDNIEIKTEACLPAHFPTKPINILLNKLKKITDKYIFFYFLFKIFLILSKSIKKFFSILLFIESNLSTHFSI